MALLDAPSVPLRDIRLPPGLGMAVRLFGVLRIVFALTLLVSYFRPWYVLHQTEVIPAAEVSAAGSALASAVPTATPLPSAIASPRAIPGPPRRETGQSVVRTGFQLGGESLRPAALALVIALVAAWALRAPTLSRGMVAAITTFVLAFVISRLTIDHQHLYERVEVLRPKAVFGASFILLSLTAMADLGLHPALYMWARRVQEDAAPRDRPPAA